MLASTPGWRLATLSTSGPSETRRVTSASAVSTVHASGTPGPPASTSGSRRWSQVHSPSKPASSAASAAARMSAAGPLIGTEQAHLLRLTDSELARVDSFETVAGREAWYTPWGDPADVRSIAVAADGTIHVNVHVGGVARSRDGGASWAPTVDVEADVHQVLAHPSRAEVVLVAAAEGLGVSRDGGDSWQFATAGLHAHYLRAVTVAGDQALVSASTGFHGRRSAIYRKRLEGGTHFERCAAGLPNWFHDNVNTSLQAGSR